MHGQQNARLYVFAASDVAITASIVNLKYSKSSYQKCHEGWYGGLRIDLILYSQ
jgi:hypothetical protein